MMMCSLTLTFSLLFGMVASPPSEEKKALAPATPVTGPQVIVDIDADMFAFEKELDQATEEALSEAQIKEVAQIRKNLQRANKTPGNMERSNNHEKNVSGPSTFELSITRLAQKQRPIPPRPPHNPYSPLNSPQNSLPHSFHSLPPGHPPTSPNFHHSHPKFNHPTSPHHDSFGKKKSKSLRANAFTQPYMPLHLLQRHPQPLPKKKSPKENLRQVAYKLDQIAHQLEEQELYQAADGIRAQAQKTRLLARKLTKKKTKRPQKNRSQKTPIPTIPNGMMSRPGSYPNK